MPLPLSLLLLLFVLLAGRLRGAEPERGAAEHVVLIVWDGMRPDFVTPEHTPVLHALGKGGVVFAHHHSIYPTSTEVNGTALATGMLPRGSGIIANNEYRPEIDARKAVATQGASTVSKGDELTGGRYLHALTVAETLQKAGHRTAIAGTKAVALLHDRTPDPATKSVTIFEGKAVPSEALEASPAGLFPTELQFPNIDRDAWTTRTLTERLWKDGVPKFSVLWLSEPDFSQHHTAPGMKMALAALKSSDACLGEVLTALEAKGVRDKTAVFVVSDHGFSTIQRSINLPELLNAGGFRAMSEFKEPAQPGDVLCVGNGGTILCYVTGRDPAVTARLVEFLQQTDFVGVLFSREPQPGTFALSRVGLDTANGPDVVISLRWNDGPNAVGVLGLINADPGRPPGRGTHATFSRFDVHNTLIASGPDFRRGATITTPTRNIDVAPTILWLLGVPPAQPLDGRPLLEAIASSQAVRPEPAIRELTAERDLPTGKWHQYLKVTTVGSEEYFDEANGAFTAH